MKKFKFGLYFFFFLFFILSFFVSGIIDSQDGFQYLAVARNIFYKHEPTAPVDEYNTIPRINIPLSTYVGMDGKTYGSTGLGYSLALVPSVAITDIFYKLYNIIPPVHFPLENDWLILFTASFTNVFFAAGLGVIIYFYLRVLNLNHKNAFLISLISFFSTNLFVLSKNSLAHMMFTFFLFSSFYFLKKYSISQKLRYLFISSVSYGITTITYNLTFLLPVIPLIIYYLLLIKPNIIKNLKKTLKEISIFLLGFLPFLIILFCFEEIKKIASDTNNISPVFLAGYSKHFLTTTPIGIILEGLYGQLVSPGRSIFLYSPILLIPIIFWNKIKSSIKPELISILMLFVFYVGFYSFQYSVGSKWGDFTPLWHGESSWGPRYLSPLIPFGILLVGHIFIQLKNKYKLLIFYPLVLFGIFVETLGILMPYQIKYHELEKKFELNGSTYPVYLYTNLLPRYSPILMMSKKLVKLATSFKNTLDNGPYNVQLYDGIDFAFNVGPERWRTIEGTGYISFDNKNFDVNKLTFDLINHPVDITSATAKINFILNGKTLLKKPEVLKITERKKIELSIDESFLKPTNNQLIINVDYGKNSVLEKKQQILGIIAFYINDEKVNLESIDVPYISQFGPKTTNTNYKNWGAQESQQINLWKSWDIHTQVYERTPDLWWIRPFYYWDVSKKPFAILFTINVVLLIFFGYKTFRSKIK